MAPPLPCRAHTSAAPILLQEDIVPQANEGSITLQGNAVTQAWSSAPRIPCSTMPFEIPAAPLGSRKNPSISFVALWVRIGISSPARKLFLAYTRIHFPLYGIELCDKKHASKVPEVTSPPVI